MPEQPQKLLQGLFNFMRPVGESLEPRASRKHAMPSTERTSSPLSGRTPAVQLRALASRFHDAQKARGEKVDEEEPDYAAALRYVQLLAEEQGKLDLAKRQAAMEKTKTRIDRQQRVSPPTSRKKQPNQTVQQQQLSSAPSDTESEDDAQISRSTRRGR